MFRRLPEAGRSVAFTIDGREARAAEADSVAAALLANGVLACRTSAVSDAPRAPYCLMGVCFECLVTIDGTPNRQGCQVRVRPGMRVETQPGRPEIEP
jgi:predicted molibdopterin-dependent oxidoreductase YjgC